MPRKPAPPPAPTRRPAPAPQRARENYAVANARAERRAAARSAAAPPARSSGGEARAGSALLASSKVSPPPAARKQGRAAVRSAKAAIAKAVVAAKPKAARKPAQPAQQARAPRAQVSERRPGISYPYHLLRSVLVHLYARDGVPTQEIATRLGVNRSYVIKQTSVPLAPTNDEERLLLDLARNQENRIVKLGLRGLLGGLDLTTTLAGGVRPKLGPLSERRAARGQAPRPAPKAPQRPAQHDLEDNLPLAARGRTHAPLRPSRVDPMATPISEPPKPVRARRLKLPTAPAVDPNDELDRLFADLGVPGYDAASVTPDPENTPAPDSIL